MSVISQIIADFESDPFTISVQVSTGVVFKGALGKVDRKSIAIHMEGSDDVVIYVNKAHIVSVQAVLL